MSKNNVKNISGSGYQKLKALYKKVNKMYYKGDRVENFVYNLNIGKICKNQCNMYCELCKVLIGKKDVIDSSTIDAIGKGTEIGMWINVPGIVTINNSTIKGNKQALMVRFVIANVTNSKLILTGTSENLDVDLKNSKVWGSGNVVPEGALIVGNLDNGTGYNYNASCTLINTNVSTTRSNVSRFLIILAKKDSFETILNYESSCNIANDGYFIWNDTESGIKKGKISVNNNVVQQREQ